MTRFGMTIRAYRLGFREFPGRGLGWLRMSRHGDGALCELLPPDGPIPCKGGPEEHVCWWDDPPEGEPRLTDCSPFLRRIRRVNKPISVVLDYNGEAVGV